jgi:two-component sensor histidine kinase
LSRKAHGTATLSVRGLTPLGGRDNWRHHVYTAPLVGCPTHEALANARKHASPAAITVRLGENGGTGPVGEVTDDGRGSS